MATDATNDRGEVGQTGRNLELFERNIKRMEELSQRLVAALATKRQVPQALQGPSQELYLKAASAWMTEAMQDPAKLIELQASYWGKTLKHFAEAQAALAQNPPQGARGPRAQGQAVFEPALGHPPLVQLLETPVPDQRRGHAGCRVSGGRLR
jgi:polyhydroxyalkanoate synthase